MITIEMWGVSTKSYGPILEKHTEVQTSLDDAYDYAINEQLAENCGGFIKIFMNKKWIPSHKFIRDYERNRPRPTKPNLKIYLEVGTNKFILLDDSTKQEVFIGDKWEVEKYLDEHGYFEDDEPKFNI